MGFWATIRSYLFGISLGGHNARQRLETRREMGLSRGSDASRDTIRT